MSIRRLPAPTCTVAPPGATRMPFEAREVDDQAALHGRVAGVAVPARPRRDLHVVPGAPLHGLAHVRDAAGPQDRQGAHAGVARVDLALGGPVAAASPGDEDAGRGPGELRQRGLPRPRPPGPAPSRRRPPPRRRPRRPRRRRGAGRWRGPCPARWRPAYSSVEITNAIANPTEVTTPASLPPFLNASGIMVSASIVRIAPPAKASTNADTPGGGAVEQGEPGQGREPADQGERRSRAP